MISIASAVAAFFKVILALLNWRNREDDREAGAAEAVIKGNEQADETIAVVNAAREDVRSELASDPSKLRAEDEFSRPD
jgi:hypothetical protein